MQQNGNAGACGKANPDSAPLVALPSAMYSGGKHCGRKIQIVNLDNGKSVTAVEADECPTCTTSTSLDLSTGAYDQIGDRDTGMLPIKWWFVD